MKRRNILLVVAALIMTITSSNAQIFKKIKKRVQETAEETAARKAEEKTAEAIDSLTEKPFKKKKKRRKKGAHTEENYEEYPDTEYEEELEEEANTTPAQLWSAYNFVPGEEVIFFDDLDGEESGEFPSRWDINKGNAENASLDGEAVIAMKQYTNIYPLMESEEYLPEVFTLEFDAYFDGDAAIHGFRYYLQFWKAHKSYHYFGADKDYISAISLFENGLRLKGKISGTEREYNTKKSELDNPEGNWKHIAIAFNKRSLKVFIDEYRVLNIPNLGFKPKEFSIGCHDQWDRDDAKIRAIKNIRVAKGGKKLYDRVVADGKFVTRGILFDVNSAAIKPESGGVLKEVAEMMQAHTDLSFRIEGHTDSDGDDAHNLQLSADRADAVKWALVAMGVAEDRFTTEGKGEAVPVADNTTPEGKANNRRVEFIKQ